MRRIWSMAFCTALSQPLPAAAGRHSSGVVEQEQEPSARGSAATRTGSMYSAGLRRLVGAGFKGGWGAGYAMTKAALERVAPILTVEHRADDIVAFSVDPGLVTTERQLAKGTATDYSTHFPAATPEVIGATVAWLVTDPVAREEYAGQVVFAQKEAKKRGLMPPSSA